MSSTNNFDKDDHQIQHNKGGFFQGFKNEVIGDLIFAAGVVVGDSEMRKRGDAQYHLGLEQIEGTRPRSDIHQGPSVDEHIKQSPMRESLSKDQINEPSDEPAKYLAEANDLYD